MSFVRALLLVLLQGVLFAGTPEAARATAPSEPGAATAGAQTNERAPSALRSTPAPSQEIIRPAPAVSVVAIDRAVAVVPFTHDAPSTNTRHAPWTLAAQRALDRATSIAGDRSHAVAARGRLRPFQSTAPPSRR